MLSPDEIVFLAGTVGLPVAVVAGLFAWRSSIRSGRTAGDHLVRVLATTFLIIGGLVIALATLFPAEGFGGHWFGADINLQLFDTVERYTESTRLPTRIVQANLIGNVALFVPLGAGVALATRRWGATAGIALALIGAAVVSAAVEGLQWVLPLTRAVDVDDVLLNTLGGLAGGIVAVVGLRVTGLAHHQRARPPSGYRRTI